MQTTTLSPEHFGLTKVAYSVREVMGIIPFKRTTLWLHVKRGNLKATRCGGKTLYFATDVAAFLAALRNGECAQ